MNDEELAKKVSEYQKLAQENPNVDVNLLMASALKEASSGGRGPAKSYRWAYTISLGVPPFGLFYALKYYFSGDDEDKRAAKVCVLLTVISIILAYGTSKLLFSSAGVTPGQIEQIKPSDALQLLQ